MCKHFYWLQIKQLQSIVDLLYKLPKYVAYSIVLDKFNGKTEATINFFVRDKQERLAVREKLGVKPDIEAETWELRETGPGHFTISISQETDKRLLGWYPAKLEVEEYPISIERELDE